MMSLDARPACRLYPLSSQHTPAPFSFSFGWFSLYGIGFIGFGFRFPFVALVLGSQLTPVVSLWLPFGFPLWH